MFIPAVDDGWAVLSEPPGSRDLVVPQYWSHSLERSLRRRNAPRSRSRAHVGVALATVALGATVGAATVAEPAAAALQSGDRGTKVRALQEALGITVDGVYGPQTARAVTRFKRSRGLRPDGIAGHRTMAALGIGRGAKEAAPAPAAAEGAPAAVEAARAMIGQPYASGGTRPGGFDCSGLTGYAFKKAGIALPRTSYDQYGVGTRIRRSDIQAGDLVFFSTAGGGASHVGVATGPDRVISATSRGVMEHAISGGYWGSNYVGARRVS